MLAQFQADYSDKVQFVFRQFPLNSIHDKAALAAQATEAAGLQGKFWEMHDLLFDATNWSAWTALSVADMPAWLQENVGKIKDLNVDQFMKDLTSDSIVKKIQDAYTEAGRIGLGGTPSVYIYLDGKLMFTPEDQVPTSYATLEAVLKVYELKERTFTQCPAMTIDQNEIYKATVRTTKGEFVMELYPKSAPVTVNSFVFLAEQGWYDNVPFHRVMEGFVAQTGDPTGTGIGGPGYAIKDEIDLNLKFDDEGVIGMANSGPNTNGSQFFITLAAQPTLDGRYTIFGRVISGMDVVKSLTLRNPATGGVLPDPDKILSIKIDKK